MDDFDRFARHLPTPLLLLSEGGQVLACNPAAQQALGGDAAAPGQTLAALGWEMLGDEDVAAYLGSCRRSTSPLPGAFRAQVAGQSVRFRCEGWRLDVRGDDNRSLLRFWPSEEENRFLVLRQNLEALNEEVRRRQALELELRESEAYVLRLYETNIIGVSIASVDGTVIDANDAALRIFGYSREELRSGTVRWRDLTAPEYRDADARALEQLKANGASIPYEKEYIRKDGSRVPVLVGAALLHPGVFERTVGFVFDISGRKQIESQREALLTELQQAVHLSEMTMGILGHDLRNPLNAIMMAGQSLLMRPEHDRPTRTLVRIVSSAERMARMIEQLLDVTRVRMGAGLQLERADEDVADIARSVVEELELAYPQRQLELRQQGDTTGHWDRSRLQQVLSNLVGNALQHGGEEGAVQVQLDGHAQAHVVIEVRNGGTIPPDLLPSLFEPFARMQTPRFRGRGLGLGLYIAERVVRAHGGAIAVRSNEEEGTLFSVTLPRSFTTTAEEQRANGQAPERDAGGGENNSGTSAVTRASARSSRQDRTRA